MELVQQKLGYRRVYLILQIPQAYWDNVTVFLLFNFFAMVGNFVAAFVSWPGPRFYWILVFGRLLFIPFFMFCNYLPTQRYPLPVLICNDWIYLIGAIIFAFLAGYLSSLGLMFNPRYFIHSIQITQYIKVFRGKIFLNSAHPIDTASFVLFM